MKYNITASIVLYENAEFVNKLIASFFNSPLKQKLFIIDNSHTDTFKQLATNNETEYIFNNKNIGFGKAHNIALQKAIDISEYHLILNPDVKFSGEILKDIYGFMQVHKNIGQLMPKVFYENGELQKLCKLLPDPAVLIGRRFFADSEWAKRRSAHYELNGLGYDKCANIPNLSGCFMFLRNEILKKAGFFDERFFMYMEDVDITRRIHRISETLFYPYVHIFHKYEKESYSNSALLKNHIFSAIKYFNKWGWFFDAERKRINSETLQQLNLLTAE